MFELLFTSKNDSYGYVLDTYDFTIEKHEMYELKNLVRNGIEIRNIELVNGDIVINNLMKKPLFRDDKYIFLKSHTNKTLDIYTVNTNKTYKIELLLKSDKVKIRKVSQDTFYIDYFDNINKLVDYVHIQLSNTDDWICIE